MGQNVYLGEGYSHIPYLLIQNKSDILSKEKEENMDKINEFSQNNGFVGYFKTSAKTGKIFLNLWNFLLKKL